MIDRALPVTRQARELGISRGSVYYLPRPTSAADLAIMRRIDALHMDFPFAGAAACCATCLPPKTSTLAGCTCRS
jgi:putative transposase